jgi:hypothetical protein
MHVWHLILFWNWCPQNELQTHQIITTNSCKTFNEFGQNSLSIFKTNHLFPFFVFNIIQCRQICLGIKLTISKSLNMNERELLNEMQTIDFDKIISKPQNIHSKIYILYVYYNI